MLHAYLTGMAITAVISSIPVLVAWAIGMGLGPTTDPLFTVKLFLTWVAICVFWPIGLIWLGRWIPVGWSLFIWILRRR